MINFNFNFVKCFFKDFINHKKCRKVGANVAEHYALKNENANVSSSSNSRVSSVDICKNLKKAKQLNQVHYSIEICKV